jgi:nucleoside-diphosphate-sugar epimerase
VSRLVALTGATGFIGRSLAAHLVARGDRVRAVVRVDSPRPAPGGVEVIRAPLTADALGRAFAGADHVVHLAGVVSTAQAERFTTVNVEGTRAAAAAARDAGARLVHISSLAAAGPAPAESPRGEDDAPAPLTAYGRSKLAAEDVVRASRGLRWTILRPGAVYGPADRAVLPLFRLAERGWMPLVGRRGAAYSFVYVDDLVRAIAAAVDGDADGLVCFVGHPQPVTVRQLLDAIRAAVGRPARLVRVPAAIVYPAALACDLLGRMIGRTLPLNLRRCAEIYSEGFVCRVDRLRERLGIVPAVGLREGTARAATWYREHGWI